VAWRVLFVLGALPALLILYVRRNVRDSEVFERAGKAERVPLARIFGPTCCA
jgi:hypothetical protein